MIAAAEQVTNGWDALINIGLLAFGAFCVWMVLRL